jgi:DHA1 family bicyclomycin/chloramphenicol resistance-like MFS transporter
MSIVLLVIAIGALGMIVFVGLSYTALLVVLFAFMFVSGIINPNTSALALMPFSKNAGVASALIGALRMVSGVIASAAISIFHNDTYLPMILFMMFCSIGIFVLLYTIDVRKKKEEAQEMVLPS